MKLAIAAFLLESTRSITKVVDLVLYTTLPKFRVRGVD